MTNTEVILSYLTIQGHDDDDGGGGDVDDVLVIFSDHRVSCKYYIKHNTVPISRTGYDISL
jgi:hypothetical protein